MSRVMSTFALLLGVVFITAALYVNAMVRADGDDPNVGVYVVGGFGLLLVLAVFLDAIDTRRD